MRWARGQAWILRWLNHTTCMAGYHGVCLDEAQAKELAARLKIEHPHLEWQLVETNLFIDRDKVPDDQMEGEV